MAATPSVIGRLNIVATTCRAAARLRLILVAVILLPAAGCTVGPNFVSPEAPIADKFREASNRSVQSTRQDYRDWWKNFHDPILNRLIQTAYNQNLTLLSAGTRVLQARAILGIAIGEFYPQVQQGAGVADIQQGKRRYAAVGPECDPGILLDQFGWRAGSLGAGFLGQVSPRRGIADGAYLASIASYDDVLVSLLGDVTATYIGIRSTEKQIAIARENVRRQEEESVSPSHVFGPVPSASATSSRRKTCWGRPRR